AERPVVVLSHATNAGFVVSMNDAFRATKRSDVVIVNSDVILTPSWFERLQDAAYSENTIGSASTLTNHGSILSLPERNLPTSELPDGLTPVQVSQIVAASSRRLRPRIPTAIGHCTYFRRSMLDVVGLFDLTFSPGYSEE